MIKLCIFDLDGTLLDTLTNITYYVNKTMERFSLGVFDKEEVKQYVGNGAKLLIERSLQALESDLSVERVLNEYIKLYNSEPTYLVKPYDGILSMLEKLKEAGIKIAVLSNKPHSSTAAILHKIFGKDYFYRAFGQRDGIPKKPDPAAVLEICEGFEKSECIFVGDTKVDIETGRNAGIHTIGVLWGFRPREELENAGADYIVSKADELAQLIINKK